MMYSVLKINISWSLIAMLAEIPSFLPEDPPPPPLQIQITKDWQERPDWELVILPSPGIGKTIGLYSPRPEANVWPHSALLIIILNISSSFVINVANSTNISRRLFVK
jgi:hypothetical protein